MTTYRYKGQTKDGTAVSGVIRAYDEFEAASRLRETVAVITRLEEVQEKKENIFNRPIGLKIKEKELALICSQFAIILSAGMSIQHCVEMVAAQTRNRHIRQMLEKVAEEVGAGYSMAQSFENNAPYLPKTFVETVRAGEQSGTLEECFQRLHRYYDKSAKTKAKVVSTLTYPAMVIVVAIVVFIIIIAVAVPAFNDVFAEMGTQLPGITRVLLAISDFFIGWWWLLLLIAAGFVGCMPMVPEAFGVGVTERGRVLTEDYQTEASGVFCAGDMRRGQSLVVWAIREGREAACRMDRFLMGYSELEG